MKVNITNVTGETNLANNEAQNNFFDVGTYEAGKDYTFVFIIGNPYEVLLHPIIQVELPKGWDVVYDDDTAPADIVLKAGEERRWRTCTCSPQ